MKKHLVNGLVFIGLMSVLMASSYNKEEFQDRPSGGVDVKAELVVNGTILP